MGARAYEGFVRQQFRRTVVEFEREILYNLTIDLRLKRMVTDGVSVTDEELQRRFHEQNDSVRIEWTAVDGDSLHNEISPSPERLREYFDSNKLRYRHAERRPLKLMTVGPDAGTSEHEVSDTEIELYYSQNQYRFENPERIKVRHILFSTMDKSEDEVAAAREKADAVLEQLRGGADFAELAQEHSEDPGNADNGGDLGWVTRGMMDPAFEQASFALQTGELIGAPVKSDFGYHLIRLDDRESGSVKPLSEVREVIRGDLKAERAQSSRYALMDNALVTAQQAGEALENAAAQLRLPFQEFPRLADPSSPRNCRRLRPWCGPCSSSPQAKSSALPKTTRSTSGLSTNRSRRETPSTRKSTLRCGRITSTRSPPILHGRGPRNSRSGRATARMTSAPRPAATVCR